jgi:anaerobic glycerol-3-phosphate dehydrogenase
MSNIIIPSSEEDRKRIRGAFEEISNSFVRIEGERSFQKDAIEALAEDVDIPKGTLRKAARVFHRQNISSVVTEVEDMEALLESI